MKKYIFWSILPVCFLFAACKKDRIEGTGSIITEIRNVVDFYNVSASGSTDVFITQGNEFEVKVKGYENIVPQLETKVQNGTLLIAFAPNTNISNDNSEVYITMPNLNSVALAGSGDLKTTGAFSGSGNFKASTSGSGNIDIESGTANNYQIDISGSGGVKSFGMVSQQAVVNISGSGEAELTVEKNLNATINGSGSIYYKGNPATVTTKITGSGQVIKR